MPPYRVYPGVCFPTVLYLRVVYPGCTEGGVPRLVHREVYPARYTGRHTTRYTGRYIGRYTQGEMEVYQGVRGRYTQGVREGP